MEEKENQIMEEKEKKLMGKEALPEETLQVVAGGLVFFKESAHAFDVEGGSIKPYAPAAEKYFKDKGLI